MPGEDPQYDTDRIISPPSFIQYIFSHTYAHTHTNTQMKQRTPSYVNYLRLHENQLAPTFSGPYWCRLNSFVLMLLSSLKSFGFNTTVSWENNSCVHIHLRYTYFYSFDIGIFEYTILNNSLFSFH